MKRPFKDKRPFGPLITSSSQSQDDEVLFGDAGKDTASQVDFEFDTNLRNPDVDRMKVGRAAQNAVGGFYDVLWVANPYFQDSTYILVGTNSSSNSVDVLTQIKQNMQSFLVSGDTGVKVESVYSTCEVSKEDIIEVLRDAQQ